MGMAAMLVMDMILVMVVVMMMAVMAVMAAFNDVDGIPMHAHRRLIRDVLKTEWGFDGVVVADWSGVGQLADHGVALHHLCTWWDVLAEARAQGAFDDATLTEVEAFLTDPRAWQAANG